MAVTYANVRVWGSGLRPRAAGSMSPALPPSAFNRARLTGVNKASWPEPRPLRGGEYRSSSFTGAPIAGGSSARALPPDAYNTRRLTGRNRREAPIPQPRTAKTRAALMAEGDAAAGDGAELAQKPGGTPEQTFDIGEIVAGLKAAAESAETDEEKDVLAEQLATLRPFVLISKKRQLTEEEQGIVDEVGRALLAQAEGAAGEEVAADTAQRIAFDREQKAISDARQVLGELELERNAKYAEAEARAREYDTFAESARAREREIEVEQREAAAEKARAVHEQLQLEDAARELPDKRAQYERVLKDALKRAKKAKNPRAKAAAEGQVALARQSLYDLNDLADQIRSRHAEETLAEQKLQAYEDDLDKQVEAIAEELPRLGMAARIAGRAAAQAQADLEDEPPPPAVTVPRKRQRPTPARAETTRRKQIEDIATAIGPLSEDIKEALLAAKSSERPRAARQRSAAEEEDFPGARFWGLQEEPQSSEQSSGPPGAWSVSQVMDPRNGRAVLSETLEKVLRASDPRGVLGTNKKGKEPSKQEMWEMIREKGLENKLAAAMREQRPTRYQKVA